MLINAHICLQRLVEDVKRQAYNNLHELVLYSDESFTVSTVLLPSLQADPNCQ